LLAFNNGTQAKGNFTNSQHNDPDEVAFWSKENETDTFLQSLASHCTRTDGVNLTYVGTAAVSRDLVSLSDAIEGPGQPINHLRFDAPTLHVKVM